MFASPWRLLGVLLAPAAAGLLGAWAAARRRGIGRALGREEVLSRVAENGRARRRAAIALRLGALALIFLALAGPQWGVEVLPVRGSARQVVVAVDTSLSMSTPDVQPNRIERAKSSLSLLLDQLPDARVGVIAFAGDAQIICPMTQDEDAAKEILSDVEVGAVPVPGTAIGDAIRTATGMLQRYPGVKSLVLLTDGEDHSSDPLGAAREAAAAGVRVFAVGIGSAEGQPIPLPGGGYKKDANGQTVVSRLDEATLSQVARRTGGAYYRTSPGGDEISDVAARIKAETAAQAFSGSATRWKNRYAWPLALAALLMLAELSLPLLAPLAAPLLLLALPVPGRAATAEGALRQGNRLYDRGQYEKALARYAESSAKRPRDARPLFNAGDALFRLDRDSEAASAFAALAGETGAPEPLRAAALYNEGDARYRAGDYAGAAGAYRRALSLAPGDLDARHNLAVAVLRQRRPPPPRNKKNQRRNQPQPNPQPKNNPPQPSRPRPQTPQNSLSREEAERILRAEADAEKDAQRRAGASALGLGRKTPKRAPNGEDW